MTRKTDERGRLSWAQWDFEAWETDAELAACSMAARGFWMSLLALAWKSEGYVLVGGKPPSPAILARLTRTTELEVLAWLAELEENGVFSRQAFTGMPSTIYSRRMVRDFKRRKTARENGSKGGNPSLGRGPDNHPRKSGAGGDRRSAEFQNRNQNVSKKSESFSGVNPETESENQDWVNLEIEKEIEKEILREDSTLESGPEKAPSGPKKAPSENPPNGSEKATWDSVEYRGDTLRTMFEAEKAGEVRKDAEGRSGEAWAMAKGVLRVLGQMSEKDAGKSVGEISRRFSLDSDELAALALATFEFGPNNPRPYMASQAQKIADRRK